MKNDCTTCPEFFDRDCGNSPYCHTAVLPVKTRFSTLQIVVLGLLVVLLGTALGLVGPLGTALGLCVSALALMVMM